MNWMDAKNWNPDGVPGSADDVTVNVSGFATVIYNGGPSTIKSVVLQDSLTVSSGSLSVSGSLTCSPSISLSTKGAGVSFTAAGATNADGVSLYADSGSTLSLPGLTSFDLTAFSIFKADGVGSVLDLSNLTTIKAATTSNLSLTASAGAKLDISAATSSQISGITLAAEGAGSVLNASQLTSINMAVTISTLRAINGGWLNLSPALTILTRFSVTSDASSKLPLDQFQQIERSTVTVSGAGSRSLTALTNANGSSIYAKSGMALSIPALTSFDGLELFGASLEAFGPGSVLDASKLTSLKGSSVSGYQTFLRANGGGKVDVSSLTSVASGGFSISAEGAGSILTANQLATLNNTGRSFLLATGGGQLALHPGLVNMNLVEITVDVASSLPVGQFQKVTKGAIYAAGKGAFNFASTTNIDGSGIYASAGALVSFPALSSYEDANVSLSTLQADGAGTVLDLSKVTSFKGNASNFTVVNAINGGKVNLGSLTALTSGGLNLNATGVSSEIAAGQFTAFNNTNASIINASGGASISVNAGLVTFNKVTLTVDAKSALPIAQIKTFTNGALSVSGGATFTMPALTNADTSSVFAKGGATLGLPGLTSYDASNASGKFLQADGPFSLLDLPNLASLKATTSGITSLFASAGGKLNLGGLTSIPSGGINLEASSANSFVLADKLANIANTSTSYLRAVSGGQVNLSPALLNLNNFEVFQSTNGGLPLAQFKSMNSCIITVSGPGSTTLSALSNADGSSIAAAAGATLNLPVLSSYDNKNTIRSLKANGVGSFLNLSKLTNVVAATTGSITVDASLGGKVDVSALQSISTSQVVLQSSGAGSQLLANQLAIINTVSQSPVNALDGGVIQFPASGKTTFVNVAVQVTNGASFLVNVLDLGPQCTLSADSLGGSLFGSATIRPFGFSAGPMTVAGNVTLAAGAALEVLLSSATTFDRLVVNGTVNLASTKLMASTGYAPSLGATFKIVDNDGVDPVLGQFTGLRRGNQAAKTSNNLYMLINYAGGDGNDVTLRAHPMGVTIESGAVQRSMIRTLTVNFTDPVTLGAGAFTLTGPAGITVNSSMDATNKIATLTFTGAPIIGGSLPDGQYTLNVNGSAITVQATSLALDADADGVPGGSQPVDFHRLFGDADGNATVNTADFAAFRTAFGGSSSIFDFDGVGGVGTVDFGAFRTRFGSSV